jgi:hypothetical protein
MDAPLSESEMYASEQHEPDPSPDYANRRGE